MFIPASPSNLLARLLPKLSKFKPNRSAQTLVAVAGLCSLLALSARAQEDPRREGSFYSQLNQIAKQENWGAQQDAPVAGPIVDPNELTEGNASSWGTFASDGLTTSVANDTTNIKVGSQSLKFVTASGFDTGVRYPATGSANLDLSAKKYLTFWVYADNNNTYGFQGNQPTIVLKSNGGAWTYTPPRLSLANKSWTLISIPLEGSPDWVRTTAGSPTMSNVSQLEIHADTWDYGFSLTLDGVSFIADPGTTLPTPNPPTGVNASAIKPRVLLYCFNPIMENKGNRRQNVVYGWQDPVTLTSQIVQDIKDVSHGLVQYQVVETVVADEHPYFADGFQHTDASFDAAWSVRDFHSSSMFDYARFAAEHNIVSRIDSGDLDEVWLYTGPISGTYESAMAGSGNYWINGIAPGVPSKRAFVYMGWNFERGVGEAIHSYGHRSEAILSHTYGPMANDQSNNWNKFALIDKNAPGLGGIGNIHYPVNGTSDYDYSNSNFVKSNADDWGTYPVFQNLTRSLNRTEWTPNNTDPQREYIKWWYDHLPHFAGVGTDGYLSNWWRYIADVDQFKAKSSNLKYSLNTPSVSITSPADGAGVTGVVPVSVDAFVDGALGRVDLYVDDKYFATDYQSPYTFNWDTKGLTGIHTLVAKADELALGREATSAPVRVGIGATVPKLSISDVTVKEGSPTQPNAVFTVTLSGASTSQVKVNYTTADGTATADSDYTPTTLTAVSIPGTLTFEPGETTKTISVPVLPDTLAEPTETFFVRLDTPINAIISDGEGQGTIIDDAAPATVSVTPSSLLSSVGVAKNLAALYTDPDGNADLSKLYLFVGAYEIQSHNGVVQPYPLINTGLYGYYDAIANKLYLRNDGDTDWLGGFAPGSANVISNSRGSLNCANTSIQRLGNTITVNWNLTPNTVLASTNRVFLKCADYSGLSDSLNLLGTWFLKSSNSKPATLSLSPTMSTSFVGETLTLTSVHSDTDGIQALKTASILIKDILGEANALYAYYDVATNKLYLRDDSGTTWLGGFAPGSANIISNSQGNLNCAATTVTPGNTLTVNWNFTSRGNFTGSKNIYLKTTDVEDITTAWEDFGDWIIKISTPPAPQLWTASELAVGSDSLSRVLWKQPNETFALWTLSQAGSVTSTPAYGPLGPWSSSSIGVGGDNLNRILLTSPGTNAAVWTMGSPTGPPYSTPAYGPIVGWSCKDMATAPDGTKRLLWVRDGDGGFAVWTLAIDNSLTSTPLLGPLAGWSIQGISVGGDGLTRILLLRNDSGMAIWTLAANGTVSSTPLFGPVSGWTASDISTGSDNRSRVLWIRNADGAFAFWNVGTSDQIQSSPLYGPIPSWSATRLATASSGGDGSTRVLLKRPSGEAAIWAIAPNGGIVSTPAYGPIPIAMADAAPITQSTSSLKTTSVGAKASGTTSLTSDLKARNAKVRGALPGGTVSTGKASASLQQVVLDVSLTLDHASSLSPTHYNVLVNGQSVQVQSITHTSSRLVLQLPADSLHKGDEVTVWLDLLDAQKHAWAGGVGPLAAR